MVYVNSKSVLSYGLLLLVTSTQAVIGNPIQYVLQNPGIPDQVQPGSNPSTIEKTFTSPDIAGILEFIEATTFPGGITGAIKIARGEANQPNRFIIQVRASSPAKDLLDTLSIYKSDDEVLYISTAGRSPLGHSSLQSTSLNLDILVFIKSNILQWRAPSISTRNLNIDILQDTWWETYQTLKLSAIHGNITGIESLDFTPHDIAIESGYGSILGNWSLPSSISLRSQNGNIDINLVPKRWSYGPSTEGDLRAHADAGNISIRMPLDHKHLSMRNGTTIVEALRGSITGSFVHGAVTELKAYNSITATIRPYWAFHAWRGNAYNYITTEARYGNTTVDVITPLIDTFYGVNPLYHAVSHHIQGCSSQDIEADFPVPYMKLSYPGEWGGMAVGNAHVGGYVQITGEDFEEVEKNANTVKVQRRPIGSDLLFVANGPGAAELRLNPPECPTPPCSDIS